MNRSTSTIRNIVGWLAALFLTVLGAKLWIVQMYGSALPVWDQWTQAEQFFKPWMEGRLTWGDWFAPHNEHRIFFTRLLDLTVIRLNGHWDPLLQMTINAGLHAGYGCALAYCLWNFLGRKTPGQICLLLLPFLALPFAAENTVRGFHSQQYFLNVGSLATVVGLGFTLPGSRRWWIGLAAAIATLFTMGSGLLAPLTVAGLTILRAFREKRFSRGNLLTLGGSLMVFGLGLELSVPATDLRQFHARSFTDFTTTFARNLSWPFLDNPLLIVIVCLPLILLAICYFRDNFSEHPAAEFLLSFGLWGGLQSAALAYGRANYSDSQASRYLDSLCVVALVSVFSTVLLVGRLKPSTLPGWAPRLLPLAFAGFIFCGIGQSSRETVTYFLASTKLDNLAEEESVRAFVATDDASILQDRLIPLPDPELSTALLRDKKLAAIMPAPCRPPTTKTESNSGWLSAAARKLRRQAMTILLAGLILFTALAGIGMIRQKNDFRGANFENLICLLAGLMALGCIWPGRHLNPAKSDYALHRTLGFHFMARSDFKQAALQFTAALQLEADHPHLANARDSAQTLQLARENISRVVAAGNSNLVSFLNERLVTLHTLPADTY